MRVPWNRGGIRTYIIIIGLVALQTTPEWILAGLPFLLVGIILHLWAKGCLHQEQEVTSSGPYRFVRHPFYTANAILDMGIAIMSGWWVLPAVLPIWWLAVYVPVMRREEQIMTSLFGEKYVQFSQGLPRLVPYRKPRPRGKSGFSWSNRNLRETEIPRTFTFLCYPVLFFMAYRARMIVSGAAEAVSWLDVLAVAGCAALFLTGRALRGHFEHRQRLLPSWMAAEPFRLAVVLAVIVVDLSGNRFEVGLDWATWAPGLAILVPALLIRFMLRGQLLLADGLLAIGLAVLAGLPWLAALILPLFVSMALDQRLAVSHETTEAEKPSRSFRLGPAGVFASLLLLGVATSVLEEFGYSL